MADLKACLVYNFSMLPLHSVRTFGIRRRHAPRRTAPHSGAKPKVQHRGSSLCELGVLWLCCSGSGWQSIVGGGWQGIVGGRCFVCTARHRPRLAGYAVHVPRRRHLRGMCVDMCVDMRADMSVNMRASMCIDMCIDICVDMRANMCVEMCVEMCVDMCADMCFDM